MPESLRPWARDALGVLGCALLIRGTWMFSPAAGFCVAGAMLLTACFLLCQTPEEGE